MDHFAKPLDIYISELAGKQDAFAAVAGQVNYPVRTQRLGDAINFPNHQEVPSSIYFYYVRYVAGTGLDVRHYFYPSGAHDDIANPANPAQWPAIPNTEAALEPILRSLIANAQANGNLYPRVGLDFQNIKWHRKSYIALFIDDECLTLHEHPVTGQDALIFLTEPMGARTGTPNHSFFDGQVFDVTTDAGPRPIFVCINHMKQDAAGTDLTAAFSPQYFIFKIFFRAKFIGGATAPITVIFDPDGNNLGPPIGPP